VIPPDPLAPIAAGYVLLLAWSFWALAGCAVLALVVTVVAGPWIWLWQRVMDRK
jgi:hypothetical protein